MTKYLKESFSVWPGESKAYRDGWDAIFKKDCPACDGTGRVEYVAMGETTTGDCSKCEGTGRVARSSE